MSEKDKKYSFRLVLEEDQHEALREMAFNLRTSKSALIREAIDLMLNKKDLMSYRREN
ncbi:MAG: ribbon-helix-helix protein, CopG family [Cyanobacteriota bacterium]